MGTCVLHLHQSISYQTTALVIPPCPSEHAIPHRHLCRAFMSRGRLCGTISRVLFAVEIGLIYLCVLWLPLPVEDGKPLPGLPGSRIPWFAMTSARSFRHPRAILPCCIAHPNYYYTILSIQMNPEQSYISAP